MLHIGFIACSVVPYIQIRFLGLFAAFQTARKYFRVQMSRPRETRVIFGAVSLCSKRKAPNPKHKTRNNANPTARLLRIFVFGFCEPDAGLNPELIHTHEEPLPARSSLEFHAPIARSLGCACVLVELALYSEEHGACQGSVIIWTITDEV